MFGERAVERSVIRNDVRCIGLWWKRGVMW